jgi:hypothetical protein
MDEVGDNSEDDNYAREVLGKKGEMEGILEQEVFQEGGRTAKTFVKETVFENKPKECKDFQAECKNTGNVTYDHTVSTHVVLGEISVTFSSNISCSDNGNLYFRPKKSREEMEGHLLVQEPIKPQRWKRSNKCFVHAQDLFSRDITSSLSIQPSCQESYLCEQNIWCPAFISVFL